MRTRRIVRESAGQALIETAIIVPLLLTIVLNAVNFAFFFLISSGPLVRYMTEACQSEAKNLQKDVKIAQKNLPWPRPRADSDARCPTTPLAARFSDCPSRPPHSR